MEQQLAKQHDAGWYQADMHRELQLWHQMQQTLGARHQMQQQAGASSSSWEGAVAQGVAAAQDPQLPDWLKSQAARVRNQQEQLHWIY